MTWAHTQGSSAVVLPMLAVNDLQYDFEPMLSCLCSIVHDLFATSVHSICCFQKNCSSGSSHVQEQKLHPRPCLWAPSFNAIHSVLSQSRSMTPENLFWAQFPYGEPDGLRSCILGQGPRRLCRGSTNAESTCSSPWHTFVRISCVFLPLVEVLHITFGLQCYVTVTPLLQC